MLYLRDEREFKDHQAKVEKAEATKALLNQSRQQQAVTTANAINASRAKMEEFVPGIFDPATGVADKLIAFGKEHGIDTDFLIALSDPSTIITEKRSGR